MGARALFPFRCRVCAHVVTAAVRPTACFRCGGLNAHEAHDGPVPRARVRFVQAAAVRCDVEGSDASDMVPWAPEAPTAPEGPPAGLVWASETRAEVIERARSGWAPWAAVTGELARRKVWLLAGPRGAGKSRTICRIASGVATVERRAVAIATGEQSAGEIAAVLQAIAQGGPLPPVAILPTRELEGAIAAATAVDAIALFVDGLQTFTLGGEKCRGGSPTLAAGVDLLGGYARQAGCAVCIAPHMTTGGEQIGGGAVLQQLCDTIVRLAPMPIAEDAPDDEPMRVRLYIDGKNRGGPVNVRRTLHWTTRGTLEGDQ